MTEHLNGTALPRASGRHGTRGGFTVIEVIIAMVILTVGVLGLAGTTAFFVRQVTQADLMTERVAAFQTIVDRMQSLPYDSVTAGTDSVGIYAVAWTVVDNGSQNKTVTIITTGPGTRGAPPQNDPAVVDTFAFRVLRR
jgi:prepilin-type N-terminal cleavage/methylation domain-containing protein